MANEAKRMPVLARALLAASAAAVLFTAGLTTTLAVRGKLRTFLAPWFGGAEATAGSAAHGAPAPEAESAGPVATAGPTFVLPSPFSSPEVSVLLDELGEARDEALVLRARLDRERRDLELIRADLDLRWEEIDRREAALEEREAQLRANGEELGLRRSAAGDERGLKTLAERVEKMTPEKAVELLSKVPADEVAEILRRVKPRESGRILEAFEPDFAAQVLERMLGAPASPSPAQNP